MCGICGWVSCSGRQTDSSTLKKMTSVLRHRGPDDSGYWLSKNVALGHTRLSIIDVDTGSQPMVDDSGCVIVFNGEIYNFREIRRTLTKRGVLFRTSSDTEVILKAYNFWGESCVQQLDGMFAFAIVDPNNKRLFLARDRLGKKPLHYFFHDGIFLFASEIKSILQHDLVRSIIDIDNRSLIDYLSLGYILSPKTIFKQIHRLAPASYAFLDWNSGAFRVKRYWKLEDYYKRPKLAQSRNRLIEEFSSIFSSAVEKRLHADVPVGAFLSSGLDSSSVVATAHELQEESLRAFSISFDEESYDESRDVRSVAAALGVNLEVDSFKDVIKDDISRIIWHVDEPFSDNSAQPTYQLCNHASKFGRVQLSGDGADEFFAGYPTYRANQLFPLYSLTPQGLQQALLSSANALLGPSYKKVSLDYKVRQFFGSAGLGREQAHFWWRVIFPFDQVKNILSAESLECVEDYHPFQCFQEHFSSVRNLSFTDQALYVDAQTWLLDDILVKVDRMSMANSVEVRCPFLDYQLVEFAAQLPTNMKMSLLSNKVIIRQAMLNRIPSRARKSKKQGFNSPPLRDATCLLPKNSRFRTSFYICPEKEDVTFKVNNLTALQVWFDMFDQYKSTGKWEPIRYGN
jgi:asparagine synthase (glutamine-hydrolysing)